MVSNVVMKKKQNLLMAALQALPANVVALEYNVHVLVIQQRILGITVLLEASHQNILESARETSSACTVLGLLYVIVGLGDSLLKVKVRPACVRCTKHLKGDLCLNA